MSAYTGAITEEEVEAMLREVDDCLRVALGNRPDDQGYICTIEGTNENFSYEELSSLVRTLEASIRLAPQVVSYSDGMLAKVLGASGGRI
jgi:hypothetical protein